VANKIVGVTLVARVSDFMSKMALAGRSVAGLSGHMAAGAAGARGLMEGIAMSVGPAGRLAGKLAGPAGLAYLLAKSVRAAVDFEQQFVMVRKVMEASDEDLDRVALGIRRIATELPITTRELNQIAMVAGQLGIAVEDMEKFTETMAMMSMATQLTAEDAAIKFARLSNILGEPIDKVDELGNLAVRLGNNLAAQEPEIMEFAMRIAAAGNQIGMTKEEIMALSGALPALGLRAEMGGTAISRIMVEIQDAVSTGNERLATFAATAGMSSDAFQQAWGDAPAQTLMQLLAGLANVKDEGSDAFQVLDEVGLGMIRTRDTALRLSGGLGVVENALSLVADEAQRNDAMLIENEKRMDTVASQATIFGNNIKEAGLSIGNHFLPPLKAALEFMNEMFQAGNLSRTARLEYMQDGDLPDLSEFSFQSSAAGATRLGLPFTGSNVREMLDEFGLFIGALDELSTGAGRRYIDWLAQAAADGDKLAYHTLRGLADEYENVSGQTRTVIDEHIEAIDVQRRVAAATGWTTDQYMAYRGLLDEVAVGTGEAADGIRDMIKAMGEQQEAIRALVDPVYALEKALGAVEEGQRDYESAVNDLQEAEKEYQRVLKDSEASQAEQEAALRAVEDAQRDVEQASWDLMRRLDDLETQVLDGEVSFHEFERRLDRWVARGEITAEQADHIRSRVRELIDTSNEYTGEYKAEFIATGNAWDRIRALRDQIAALPTELHINAMAQLGGRLPSNITPANPSYTPSSTTTSSSYDEVQYRAEGGRFDPGWLMVGEDGPELMHVGYGGNVYSTTETEQMLAGAIGMQTRALKAAAGSGTSYSPTIQVFGAADRQTLSEARHQQRLAFMEMA
jgi:TP901 family phage tail tape measure protein